MISNNVVTDFDFSEFRANRVKDVLIVTESGASYNFMAENGNVLFSRGLNICGKVLKFNSPAKVGMPLSFSFSGRGLYSPANELVSYRNSTPIVKITINP